MIERQTIRTGISLLVDKVYRICIHTYQSGKVYLYSHALKPTTALHGKIARPKGWQSRENMWMGTNFVEQKVPFFTKYGPEMVVCVQEHSSWCKMINFVIKKGSHFL